jgi:hypothetical protein
VTDQPGFPGERPEHLMRKLAKSNPHVTCDSCRQFDGAAWCRRWNYHTEPAAPICDQYRPLPPPPAR